MSKLLLKILVCAGFGFYAFPISSAEKREQEALSERTKALSLSSQGELADSSIPQPSSSGVRKGPKLLMNLEDRQKEVQKRNDDYPFELVAAPIKLILSAPYVDDEPFLELGYVGRRSTDPVEYAPNKWVTAKIAAEVFMSLRKAVLPKYAGLFLENIDEDEKIRIFNSIRDAEVGSVHPQIVAKRTDILQLGVKGGTAISKQEEHNDKEAESDLTLYHLMVRMQIDEKFVDIPLQYPVRKATSGKTYRMLNAILPLNFTFFKEKEVKKAEAKSPVLLPSDSPEKKERRKEKKRASESAPAKKTKVVLSSEKPKGTQLRLETRPLIPLKTGATRSARSASAPKPTFMKGIEDRQVKLPPIPLDLTPYQTVCILNSVSDEAIEIVSESVWAHAKMRRETVDAIIRAVCEACLITPTVLKTLTEKEIQAACPTLSAHFMDIKDTDYHGGTSTSKEKEKGSGKGALVSYNLTLDNQPLQYRAHPSSPKMLPVPLLEVSITRVALGEKSEEKA